MRWLVPVLVGLAVGSPAAQASDRPVLPTALAGIWGTERDGDCARGQDGRAVPVMTFAPEGALFPQDAPTALGSYAGIRQITPSRWYMDIDVAGALVSLDVNAVSPRRILVARRPLGEADFLVRCEEAPCAR